MQYTDDGIMSTWQCQGSDCMSETYFILNAMRGYNRKPGTKVRIYDYGNMGRSVWEIKCIQMYVEQ